MKCFFGKLLKRKSEMYMFLNKNVKLNVKSEKMKCFSVKIGLNLDHHTTF